MQELIFATSNQNKISEVQSKFNAQKFDLKILPVPQPFNPIENGQTFLENAYIKAYEAAKITGKLAFADDTGLCVKALGGRPGIFSARYANENENKIQKLLNEMKNIKNFQDREAFFACAIVLVSPDGKTIFSYQSKFDGFIAFEPKGKQGFGYDPIFYIKVFAKTLAELSINEKNQVSHRSIALNEFIKWWENNI